MKFTQETAYLLNKNWFEELLEIRSNIAVICRVRPLNQLDLQINKNN